MERIKKMMIPVRKRKINKMIQHFFKEWQGMSFLDVEDLLRDEILNFFYILHKFNR
jgi:hypothetical protein